VRRHLPAETPVFTQRERDEAIRKRRVGYQMRQHW